MLYVSISGCSITAIIRCNWINCVVAYGAPVTISNNASNSDHFTTLSWFITWLVCLSLWWFLQCIKIMHRFAQCMVNWKIFQNADSHISQSQWRNCENWYTFPWLCQTYDAIILQAISYTTNQNSYSKYNQFHWKLSVHDLQNRLMKLFTIYTYLRLWFVSIQWHWYHYDVTKALSCTWITKPYIDFLYNARFITARFGNSQVDFGFVMYQNNKNRVKIGIKHDVPCIVRSKALRSPSDTSVHWMIIVAT